jgi:hypothetical protein
MGHLRLGRLPKSLRWQAVVALLSQTPSDVPAITRATLAAAEGRFRAMANDPIVGYCFWLLSRVTHAARGSDFQRELDVLRLSVGEHSSTLSFCIACG